MDIESLESKLGVSFRDRVLLRLALTHSSYLNENRSNPETSNERLEFLGDAVIGVAIADELYRRNPDWTEGEMTQARAALVSGEALAAAARKLDLGSHLSMGRGEETSGGRERENNLAAALEAIVGALFLDRGYEAARPLVLRVVTTDPDADADSVLLKNPKSALQEAVQRDGLDPPTYRIVDVTGRDHMREFTAEVSVDGRVMGTGTGARKLLAEREAAGAALREMQV